MADLSHSTEIDVPDEELIGAALAGESEAFGKLMRKYQQPLFEMIFRNLRQREEAEDVLQQSFLQAYRHLAGFRKESKLYTWLYTIALNQVRNHLRQKKNRATSSLDDVQTWDDQAPLQWKDPSLSVEDIVAQKTEVQTVEKALETLSEDLRTIFILYYFQHLSLEEVAQRLGRPVGTVKVYLHRSRKALYQALNSAAPTLEENLI